jgi:HEAT repeat protein
MRSGPALFFILAACMASWAQVSGPGQAFTPEIASRLVAQIAHGNSEQKRSALLEIRNYQVPEASRIGLPALRDKDELVRSTAASSVIYLPKSEAAQALIPLLGDKAEFVRREAAHALGEVGDSSATEALVGLLRHEKVLEVRSAVAIALGKIGDVSAVESLANVLRTPVREDDEFVRRSAARSIGQIAQKQLTGETRVLTPQNFLPEKFKDLDSTGSANVQPAIVGLLTVVLQNDKESDDTRREAAYALGAIGDPSAKAVLERFSTSSDPYMAEICKEALLKIQRHSGN